MTILLADFSARVRNLLYFCKFLLTKVDVELLKFFHKEINLRVKIRTTDKIIIGVKPVC